MAVTGMMDAAANALLQNYFDLLGKRGHRCAKSEDGVPYHDQARNLNHIMWMCSEAQTLTDPEKKNRWIGFIQGALWMSGLRTINELKGEVINALETTRAFEELKRKERKVYQQPGSLYCRMEGCREFAQYDERGGFRSSYCREHTPIPMEVKP